MSIIDEIANKREEWYVMGNLDPDAVIIGEEKYYTLVREINFVMTAFTSIDVNGKHKVFGLELIIAHNVTEIRVAKTKP